MVCFPFAGGQSLSFRAFADSLPRSIDVWAIDPPAHGWAAGPPLDDVQSMADLMIAALPEEILGTSLLFGHSLGGLVALEVARVLQSRGRPAVDLVLSASRPPHRREDYGSLVALSDRELLELLVAMGGVPAEWRQQPDVFDLFKDTLRADFRAFEAYRPGPPLTNTRVLALGGLEDSICRPGHVFEWSRHCPQCEVDFVPGGHLFVVTDPALVANRVARFMRRST